MKVFNSFGYIKFEIFKGNFKLSLAIAAINFWALKAGNFFKYVNLRVKHLLPLSVDFSDFICLLAEYLGHYFESLAYSALELVLGLLRFLYSVCDSIIIWSFQFDVRVDCVHKILNQIIHGGDVKMYCRHQHVSD